MNYKIKKLQDYIDNVNYIGIISITLACAMLQLVLKQIFTGYFTPAGFSKFVHYLVQTNGSIKAWNIFLLFLSDNAVIAIPIIIASAFIAVFGMFFFTNIIFPFIMIILFAAFWASSNTDYWAFEFVLPCLFSLIVMFGQYSLYKGHNFKLQLGYKLLPGNNGLFSKLISISLAMLILGYFNYLSKNGRDYILTLSFLFPLMGGLAIFISISLDKFRMLANPGKIISTNNRFLAIFAAVIGLMLVYQVQENEALKSFTPKGYKEVIDGFLATTNAPGIIKFGLAISSKYSSIFLPIQVIFEYTAAICLFLGIFRTPIYWLTTGLLAMLMIVEFGAPDALVPTSMSDITWLWELLLPTVVLLLCSIHATSGFFAETGFKKKFLGYQLFSGVNTSTKIHICILLIGVCMLSLAEIYSVTEAIYSWSIFYGIILFVIMIALDPIRAKPDNDNSK